MTYKSLKSITIFVSILFVLSTVGATLGYTTRKNSTNNENNTPAENGTITEKHIKYKYFLEGVEVSEMPRNKSSEDANETNETDENELLYKFDEYKCSNGVTGEFNNDEWKFIPSEDISNNVDFLFSTLPKEPLFFALL